LLAVDAQVVPLLSRTAQANAMGGSELAIDCKAN
jgi:hypothetical protein